jgi:hypothetical protein
MRRQSKVDDEAVEEEIRKAKKSFSKVGPLKEAGFRFSKKSFWTVGHNSEETVTITLESPILKGDGLQAKFKRLYKKKGRTRKTTPKILIDKVGGSRVRFLIQGSSSLPWHEKIARNMNSVLEGGEIQAEYDTMQSDYNQIMKLFEVDKLEQMTSWENPFDRDEWKNPMEVTRDRNRGTVSRLIRMGSQYPELREHLRPVLDHLHSKRGE